MPYIKSFFTIYLLIALLLVTNYVNATEANKYIVYVYYDNSRAMLRDTKMLSIIDKASTYWEECGVIFVNTTKYNDAVVIISWDDTNAAAYAAADLDGLRELEQSSVSIYRNSFNRVKSEKQQVMILVHEYGHLLGLDHNNNIMNIMFPYADIKQKMSKMNLRECLSNVGTW